MRPQNPVLSLAICVFLVFPLQAQSGGQEDWPPPGWILSGDLWMPADAIFGDAVYAATPWPGGVVPYEWGVGTNPVNRAMVMNAFAEIEAVSQVRFIPRNGNTAITDYIRIRENPNSNNSSNSAVGRVGGVQEVRIGLNNWNSKFLICHELMHALGFWHEHQRADRDLYVRVNAQNISQTDCSGLPCNSNFDRIFSATTIGGYDFLSIMHYGRNTFSNGSGPTIETLPAYSEFNTRLGNLRFMTALDARGIASRYGAPSQPILSSISPSSVVAGSPGVSISLTGSLFHEGSPTEEGIQGSRVFIDGREVPTIYVNATTLIADIPMSLLATPGFLSVAVQNDLDAGFRSNALPLNVTYAPCGTLGDKAGWDVARLGDVTGDERPEFLIGSPGANGRGSVICRGSDGSEVWTRSGNPGDQYGHAIASIPDFNGDGFPDCVVGAPGWNSFRGYVHVLSGLNGSVLATYTWNANGAEFGWDVASPGDLNGDQVPDILVGIPGSGVGGAWRLLSGATGTVIFSGSTQQAGARYGERVAGGGDASGDGVPDFLVSAPTYDGTGLVDSGRAILFSGANNSVLARFDGDASYDYMGRSLAQIRGPNRGGIAWSLVGAADFGSILGSGAGAGYARLFRGRESNPLLSYGAAATFRGDALGDRFGQSVASAGDLDDDGVEDFVVGADQAGAGASGRIGSGYVRAFSGADFQALWTESGAATDENFGWAVEGVQDIDGDASDEILVGAPLGNVPCVNAGTWRIVDPRVPPKIEKVMITELVASDPQAIELTNFADSTINLQGWKLLWRTNIQSGPIASTTIRVNLSSIAPINVAPGARVVIVESGGPAPAVPLGTIVLYRLPSIGVPATGVTVALENTEGLIVDEVQLSPEDSGLEPLGLGGHFRGVVRRDPSDPTQALILERIGNLDSNSGGDWTIGSQSSLGLENLAAGVRGFDPIRLERVLINEIDTVMGYVELQSRATFLQPIEDLRGWRLWLQGRQGSLGTSAILKARDSLFLRTHVTFGRTPTPPAEQPLGIDYFNDPALSNTLSFQTREFALSLWDHRGRLVDLVRGTGDDDQVVHNHPRMPATFEDFTGFADRSTAVNGVIGRINQAADTNRGTDFVPQNTRSMGFTNLPAVAITDPTLSGLDVRWNSGPSGTGLTMLITAGPENAGAFYSFLWSFGHLFGTGPLFGLGPDALSNYVLTVSIPPFSGFLDDRGAARIDFGASTYPPGLALDAIFILQSPGGQLLARTGILMFDT